MENNIPTRQIPKKSLYIIAILILLGIATFFLTQDGKSKKVTKILHKVGYKNVKDVKVYGVTKVEDKDTRIQGFKYFVIFKDIDNNQECRGFVSQDFKRNTKKDISCKDIK
jgi:hypothetical protein